MHRLTAVLAAGLSKLGLALVNDTFFDTLTLVTGERTSAIHEAALARDANLRRIDGDACSAFRSTRRPRAKT